MLEAVFVLLLFAIVAIVAYELKAMFSRREWGENSKSLF